MYAGGRLSSSAIASRVCVFASCISSRSVFIDHVPALNLRAIYAFVPLAFSPRPDQAAECFAAYMLGRKGERAKASPEGLACVPNGGIFYAATASVALEAASHFSSSF